MKCADSLLEKAETIIKRDSFKISCIIIFEMSHDWISQFAIVIFVKKSCKINKQRECFETTYFWHEMNATLKKYVYF